MRTVLRPVLALTLAACGNDTGGSAEGTGITTLPPSGTGTGTDPGPTGDAPSTGEPTGVSATGGMATTGTSTDATTADPPTTGSIKLDVGAQDDSGTDEPPPVDMCKVQGDEDASGPCRTKAPSDSFNPDVQWEWWGPDEEDQSSISPLVANLTDDNGDGAIDLCDIPDVVAVATNGVATAPGHIYVLDGATGTLHYKIPELILASVTPALGDIDGDGLVEIVTMDAGGLIAFENDGTLKWKGATPTNSNYMAVALADLDNDGDVEIIVGNFVADHNGVVLWSAPDYFWQPGDPIYLSATAAADLDGDGDQEVVMGRSAYHHDGTPYYSRPELSPGYPQIADLDDDGLPEVLITNLDGLALLEHDGAVKYSNLRPTGDPSGYTWLRPATIHDFTGDGKSEYATSSATHYSVFAPDASIVWTANVAEFSCCAAGTAFDFLGDGVAEAMYADEQNFYIYDGGGQVLLSSPRTSWTNIEYPVVVDVDNDASAEILVVSNSYDGFQTQTAPTVQVIRDVDERWIQARRIWNQHTYHVTNVREDGTIPQFEKPSWKNLNTYRTNAQIEGGGVCKPPIPG